MPLTRYSRFSGIFLSFFFCPASVSAGTLKTLYSFHGDDGSNPAAVTVGAGGVLYGVTSYGGAFGTYGGTVFSLSPPASPNGSWTQVILRSFGGAGDGSLPSASLAIRKGVLYGTTSSGGTYGYGTFFSLSPPASPGGDWTETLLWNFGGSGDGTYPGGILSGEGGVFYGITSQGGAFGMGTVYSLAPPASSGLPWTETVLYSFAGGVDGSEPSSEGPGLAMDSAGVLYGTTGSGGDWTEGIAFSLAPPAAPGGAWTETVLHAFRGGLDGGFPGGGVILGKNGVLYGTTVGGGPGSGGTIFSLTPPASSGGAWRETVLYRFEPANGIFELGYEPWCNLLQVGGALYGTTFSGGTSASPSYPGYGVVFELEPPVSHGAAWTLDVLFDFDFGDGSLSRFGLVRDASGVFYGTTLNGGEDVVGTVFSYQQ